MAPVPKHPAIRHWLGRLTPAALGFSALMQLNSLKAEDAVPLAADPQTSHLEVDREKATARAIELKAEFYEDDFLPGALASEANRAPRHPGISDDDGLTGQARLSASYALDGVSSVGLSGDGRLFTAQRNRLGSAAEDRNDLLTVMGTYERTVPLAGGTQLTLQGDLGLTASGNLGGHSIQSGIHSVVGMGRSAAELQGVYTQAAHISPTVGLSAHLEHGFVDAGPLALTLETGINLNAPLDGYGLISGQLAAGVRADLPGAVSLTTEGVLAASADPSGAYSFLPQADGIGPGLRIDVEVPVQVGDWLIGISVNARFNGNAAADSDAGIGLTLIKTK